MVAYQASLTPAQRRENGKKAGAVSRASITPEQRSAYSRKGGRTTAAALTPEQRKEKARKARNASTGAGQALTRWNQRKRPDAFSLDNLPAPRAAGEDR